LHRGCASTRYHTVAHTVCGRRRPPCLETDGGAGCRLRRGMAPEATCTPASMDEIADGVGVGGAADWPPAHGGLRWAAEAAAYAAIPRRTAQPTAAGRGSLLFLPSRRWRPFGAFFAGSQGPITGFLPPPPPTGLSPRPCPRQARRRPATPGPPRSARGRRRGSPSGPCLTAAARASTATDSRALGVSFDETQWHHVCATFFLFTKDICIFKFASRIFDGPFRPSGCP